MKQDLTIIFFYNEFEENNEVLFKLNNNNYCYIDLDNEKEIYTYVSQWLEYNYIPNDHINDIINIWACNTCEQAFSKYFNISVFHKKFYEKNFRKCNQLDSKGIYNDNLYNNYLKYYNRKKFSIKA